MEKRYTLAVVIAALILAVSPIASAVDYGGVGGRPANPRSDNPRTQSIFIYELKPGQSASDGVRIYNNTSAERTIDVEAVDSVLASGGAFSCAQAVDAKIDVGAWVSLGSHSVTVPSNSSEVVPFTITVPENAGVGEHDGCVTIQDMSMTETPKGQSGVVLGFRSAIRVVVTVPGAIVKRLHLAAVTVSRLKSGDYLVVPKVQNDGNVSLDTTVHAKLTAILGRDSGQKGGTYPVLPHSSASWNLELPQPFWGGWYRAVALVSYNSNPTAGIGDPGGSAKSEQLSSPIFFTLPSPLAGFIELLVVAAVAGVAAWVVRRRLDARRVRAHWVTFTAEAGDSLASLAKEYHVSWRKIARVNGLKPPYSLQAGQKLRLPASGADAWPAPQRKAKTGK